MKTPRTRQTTVLAVAIGALLTIGASAATETSAAAAAGQSDPAHTTADVQPAVAAKKPRRSVGRTLQQSAEPEAERPAKSDPDASKAAPQAMFPLATRTPPEAPALRKSSALGKTMELYNGGQQAEARVAANAILGDADAGKFEKAYAAQIAAHSAYGAGDVAAAAAFYEQVIALDALDNNSHYGSMLNLAQLQHRQKQFAESIATFDRLASETRSSTPEHMIMRGQALYSLGKYPEAAASIKQAIEASPTPNPQWQALLMQAHMKDGNPADALKLAEKVAAASPDDLQAQHNLAVAYQQNGLFDKTVVVLEKLRQSGQLTEPSGYEQLYVAHLKLDGHHRQAIEVINDGLAKGVLKPEFQPLVALAQSYYFSEQIGPAITAYEKAAPLDDDGETYLNLANVLWQENRIPEAKAAARKAMAKGVKQPERAKTILALSGG